MVVASRTYTLAVFTISWYTSILESSLVSAPWSKQAGCRKTSPVLVSSLGGLFSVSTTMMFGYSPAVITAWRPSPRP